MPFWSEYPNGSKAIFLIMSLFKEQYPLPSHPEVSLLLSLKQPFCRGQLFQCPFIQRACSLHRLSECLEEGFHLVVVTSSLLDVGSDICPQSNGKTIKEIFDEVSIQITAKSSFQVPLKLAERPSGNV